MIDLKEVYDNLPEPKYDHLKPKGFRSSRRSDYSSPPSTFVSEISNQIDIDRFGPLSGYSSKFNNNDKPNAILTGVKLEDEVPIKIRLKIHGYYSNKKYQRTIQTPNGELDETELKEKINELIDQIDPVETEAEFRKKTAGNLEPKLRNKLKEAFGDKNVGKMYDSTPVKLSVKKDGSARFQITDMSAEGMMRIASFISENDLDLDL